MQLLQKQIYTLLSHHEVITTGEAIVTKYKEQSQTLLPAEICVALQSAMLAFVRVFIFIFFCSSVSMFTSSSIFLYFVLYYVYFEVFLLGY